MTDKDISAATEATEVVSSQPNSPAIRYQGRPAKRADSRERRRLILEATLRIIVRDGIRGVRHRAVAKEAGVPLAATTYYFKDIGDLITDAFNLYAEDCLASTRQLEEESFAVLNALSAEELASPPVRGLLVSTLSDFIVRHIHEQVADRDMRMLESAFRNESLRNPQLAAIAKIPQQQMLQTIIDFFALLKAEDPEAEAHIVMGTILHLEYESLIEGGPLPMLQRTVHRLVESAVIPAGT